MMYRREKLIKCLDYPAKIKRWQLSTRVSTDLYHRRLDYKGNVLAQEIIDTAANYFVDS
jgi:hypothetical protein